MPRLATLSEINRQSMLSFPCWESEKTPWSPLRKPLSQARLVLVTSAGIHLRDDKAFIGNPQGGDSSYRVMPSTAKAADILQSHVSRSGAYHADAQCVRYCIDDLKAFYYEARMTQRPMSSETDLHRWFWGDTAVSQLIRSVAQQMSSTDDPALKYFAYGLAR